MHLSVWLKTGLVTVCYLVLPDAPYTCRFIWSSLQLEMKFRIVKNKLWVVFKTSVKEFCPRVPKDVIDWRIIVSWIVIFVINVCTSDCLFLWLFCFVLKLKAPFVSKTGVIVWLFNKNLAQQFVRIKIKQMIE